MECPNCHATTTDPLICSQCGSAFCDRCQPDWDITGEICSGCSEINTIEALKEDSLTARMRRWFSKKIPAPEPPSLIHPPPYSVRRNGSKWDLHIGDTIVAVFDDCSTADYVCRAANQHYQLSGLAILVYNRIREGDVLWNGSKSDCELWTRLRTLLKS